MHSAVPCVSSGYLLDDVVGGGLVAVVEDHFAFLEDLGQQHHGHGVFLGDRHGVEERHLLYELSVLLELRGRHFFDRALEGLAVYGPEVRVYLGLDGGGARRVVHEREVAEAAARAQLFLGDVVDLDLHQAFVHDEEAAGRVVLSEDVLVFLHDAVEHAVDDVEAG